MLHRMQLPESCASALPVKPYFLLNIKKRRITETLLYRLAADAMRIRTPVKGQSAAASNANNALMPT